MNWMNNQMMISSESAVITGSVRDKDGIKEISYEIDDLDGNVQSNPIDNVENWSFEEDFNIGTSKITITAIDNLNNETQKVFSIVRVNDKIIVQDNVDLFDESESQSFFNGIYEVFEAGMGTEDLSDDGIVVIIARNNEIVPKLTLDNIVYIAPGSAFPAGFTGKVNAIMAPSEIELGDNYLGLESGMTEYSDEEFIAVKFVTPSYDEVIAEDICLKSEGEVDFDQDLVFAFGPNGENLLEESEVTPYSFFKGAKPKISYEEGELEIGFDDVILYDKDNDLETKNDQIRIDGNLNLSNMKYNGGIEVAKWDINPLPKQAGVNFTYDLDESLSIYWESKHSTEDIIEKINQGRSGFKNKVSLGSLFSVEGVNTNKEIYLATFGVGMFTGTGSAELGVGYMGNYAVRSLAQPIILINVVLCVNGELKLKIAGSMTKSSKESIGVTAVRKGFLESFVDKNSFTQRILGNHVLANYNIKTVGDSKNRNTKVELDASGTAEGHLGYGINGSMMYLGIIPISGTLSNQIDCELEGKLGFVKENKNAASFEIEGKYTLGMSAYVEPQIKYALSVEKTGFEAGISYYDKLKLFEFFKIEKEKNNATKLKGYLYTDETEKTLVTRNNLLIEMKGDNAFEYESDVKNGVFSLDKIMSGKYTVNLMDAKTHQNIASQEVEIIRNKDNIVKFYIKDIPPEQKYETLILNPGDSYRLTCKKGDSLYVRAKKDTVYDYYCPASTAAEYQEDFAQGSEFYVPQNENEFVELKVNSGEMEVFVLQNGGVDQKPDKNLSESYTITNLNGSELFHVFEVNAGETFTIDFPVDGTKADSRTIWGFPEKGLSYEYEYDIIDYYWNKNFGWEITTETYSYDGDTGFWFALSNYEKRVFRVTRGTLILLYHRNDTDLTVY